MPRKWSPASKVFAVLALASGMAAYAVVHHYEVRLEALRPLVGPAAPVLLAAEDLARGTELSASMVRIVEMPAAFVPPGALSNGEQAAGRILVSDLAEGEPLTRTRLAVKGSGRVAALVPPGLRAFAVSTSLPAGSVTAGDHVDVLATLGGGRPHTETVATGLEILLVLDGDAGTSGSIGAVSGEDSNRSLVLLVSPDVAERLAYANAFADLAVSIEGTETVASP